MKTDLQSYSNTVFYQEFQQLVKEWDGDIKDATESLATRSGVEGVEAGSERWFDDYEKKITASTIEGNAEILHQSGFDKDLALRLAIAFAFYKAYG